MSSEAENQIEINGKGADWPFRGVCLGVPRQEDMEIFKRLIAEVLPAYKCNALVLLIRYRYEFESHPEISDRGSLTKGQAADIAALCRQNNIRIIPKMNLLGHQSEKNRGSEQGLLRVHPEFDETPDLDTVRYCRSLCPRHPEVKDIVFELGDELIDALGADAIHVGLDEVFEIGLCPRCKGIPNAELFADWVNALHGHFVNEKKVEMLRFHRSQKEWLDKTQGMDSYVESMKGMSQEVGKMSGQYQYAEGWQRHVHLGFAGEDFNPLTEILVWQIKNGSV